MSAANPLKQEETLSIRIEPGLSGKRLDVALAAATELSRARIQQLLREGYVRRLPAGGGAASGGHCSLRASDKVFEGDRFLITLPATEHLNLEPEEIPLEILFEDEHLLIINKPAGMVVHPSAGHWRGTLVHALLHHCPNLPGINGVERPGIVHRLDKDTSGSIVVAKTEAAHHALTEMFAAHRLTRQYLAWCRGSPRWKKRRIELPIARHPVHRRKMAVHPQGKEAVTDVEVEHCFGPFCQLRLTLHTGRTHQIRVHLSQQRLPILGDPLYARSYDPGKEIPEPSRSVIAGLKRQALHAELLAFVHPITDQQIRIHAPLPDDLRKLVEALRRNYG